MKDAEEAIGKVMAGMRGVEAASGLEGRVAEGVRRRIAGRVVAGGRFGRGFAVGGFRWMGFGCVAMLLVVALGVQRMEKRSALQQGVLPQTRWPRTALPVTSFSRIDGGSDLGARSGTIDGRGALAGAFGSDSLRLKVRSGDRRYAGAGSSSGMAGGEVALANTRAAVSYPAPPLPLTEEERLLLRVVHRGDPEQVAMLDARERAREDSDDALEYGNFFGREIPPVPAKPGGSE